MGFCRCCSVTTALIATLIAIVPIIYQQIDQREFNRRSTAEEAAKGANWKNKIAIVTGASSGIGIPTAKVLYENGATVIMACRNKKKATAVRNDILSQINNNALKDTNLKVMLLDLASLKSIDSFVESFKKTYNKLNILINNAGVMGYDNYNLSPDGIELQFAINNLGHFYLTQRLTDLLIESVSDNGISRVINTASGAYMQAPTDINSWLISQDKLKDKNEYSGMRHYGLTKALNIIYAKEYNKRYADKGVYAVSLHPGIIKTGLQRYNFYFNLMSQYMPSLPGMKTISQGAATQIRCAAMSDSEFKKNGGRYFEDCNSAILLRGDVIDNDEKSDELGKLFYDLSETIIKEKGFSLE
eukprot:61471_1